MSKKVFPKTENKTLRFLETSDQNEEKVEESTPLVENECLWPEEESNVEEEQSEVEINENTILSPDNPLLEKFQKALKEHLLKQIEFISSEVFELESGTKKLNNEREKLGIEAYEIQQILNKQQEDIKTCEEELENSIAAKEQVENELKKAIEEYKKSKNVFLETSREEVVLRKEVETVDLLYQQISSWEQQVESDLLVKQRIFEKSEKEKMDVAIRNRDQDAMIYRLMKEIWRIEGEIETTDMQIRVKEEEREQLHKEIISADIDLKAFHDEDKRLMQSWSSLLVAIGYRDKVYSEMENELDKKSEKLRSIIGEIGSVKKLVTKEIQKNEEIEIFKDRVTHDFQNCMKRLDIEYDKKYELDEQLMLINRVIEQTEKDINFIKAQNSEKMQRELIFLREIQTLDSIKGDLENQILNFLEEQITNDKASKHLQKLVREAKDKVTDLEITLANSENLNSKVIMEIESLKFLSEKTQQLVVDLEQQQNAFEIEIKKNKDESNKIIVEVLKKKREVNLLNKKIETIMLQTGGVEVSPLELKIMTMEKKIHDLHEDIKKLEQFWLREQTYVVNLTQQKQKQMRDINIMKKQIMLLTQKNLTIGDELEAFNKESDKIDKNTVNMLNRLTILNEKVNSLRGNKENLDKAVMFKQNECLASLENVEMELLDLECECSELEKEKQEMSEQLIEVNREVLVWEKKLMMVLELKKQLKLEQSEEGEVGTMKSEIHRMQVRLGQLKKAQDKLLHDLQHCLSRREAIVSTAEAREKRTKGAVDQTRMNFEKKLEDTKIKHQQIQKEIEIILKEVNKADEEKQNVRQNINEIENKLNEIKNKIQLIKNDFDLAETENEKSSSIFTLKQKKLSIYLDLSKGKQPYILYCSDKTINPELEKQKELNNILITLVQKASSQFPERRHHFFRIHNTLTIPMMYL